VHRCRDPLEERGASRSERRSASVLEDMELKGRCSTFAISRCISELESQHERQGRRARCELGTVAGRLEIPGGADSAEAVVRVEGLESMEAGVHLTQEEGERRAHWTPRAVGDDDLHGNGLRVDVERRLRRIELHQIAHLETDGVARDTDAGGGKLHDSAFAVNPCNLERPRPQRRRVRQPDGGWRPGRAATPAQAHQAEVEPAEPPVDLAAFLEGIGVPEPRPFVPDAWQEEALRHLATTDVIVSVPTGSGKTYVAIEAARRAMALEETVIYTSPLKALSNTKFTEFVKLFGAERVGILTGDRRDNPQAPLLIMTTEILRNLLYDAAGGEIDVRLDTLGLVILDESQYIADPDRGVVWEETIIFCPGQARLLLLSASIGNPHDVAAWLTTIRPIPCHLVRHHRRSVPLRAGYLHPNGKLTPLFKTTGIPPSHAASLHPEAKRLFAQYEEETLRPR